MAQQENPVDLWRERLRVVQLPPLSGAEHVDRLLSAGVSLQEVGHLLEDDPALALDVVLAAARLPSGHGDVQSLQHALNLLGVRRVRALVRVRTTRSLNPDSAAHRACLQAIAVGRFAASLVGRWEPASRDFLSCVTLLLGVARWKLPLAAPQLAAELEQRVTAGERRSRVEQALLGCSIDALNRAVLIDAGFPEESQLLRSIDADALMLARAARHAWTDNIAPEMPSAVARWLRQRSSPCLLAHMLAWAAHDGWYERRTRVLLGAVSARNNEPLDRVTTATHRSAVHVSRRLERHAGLIFTPAEQLFWPPRPPRSPTPKAVTPLREVATAPALEPAAALRPGPPVESVPEDGSTPPSRVLAPQLEPAAPPRRAEFVHDAGGRPRAPGSGAAPTPEPTRRPDTRQLHAFVHKCRTNAFADLRQLVAETGVTLDRGLALPRSLLFLRSGTSDRVRCYLKHGLGEDLSIATLEMSASEDNLLLRLLHQGASLRVDSATSAAATHQLPATLRALALPSGFAVTCIRMDERPVGLIWADSGNPNREVLVAQYDALRAISAHFGNAFRHLARRIRQ